jgi:D-erythronate 2-dehydrogenase
MHLLVIGAAGMVGRKFLEKLAKTGTLGGKAVREATLTDVVAPAAPAGAPFPSTTSADDLSTPGVAEKLVARRPDTIIHLAAIVSGEAEADFEKGYRINLDGTQRLLEAIRKVGDGYKPRLVFTSSIAVFGAPFPDKIGDEFFHTPLTSYGTQKAMGELLLADYSRRGFLDGVGIRLPTIVVRPGKPNKAASGFFSGILREPLSGQDGHPACVRRRAALDCEPPRGRALPRARSRHRHLFPGREAEPHHAGTVGDRRRDDRRPRQGGRRQGRVADPPRA